MPHGSNAPERSFGYLSTLESPEHGFFGGYLIVGPMGRPLEFHCTAPIRPSRAQQILYGPTLEPFLLGEQIAGAMLDAAKLRPSLILANCEATLHARTRIHSPMVLLRGNEKPAAGTGAIAGASTDFATTHSASSGPHDSFVVEGIEFLLPIGFESDRDTAIRLLTALICQIDLAEPFGRIEEAIREAQRLGGSGAETHEQAA